MVFEGVTLSFVHESLMQYGSFKHGTILVSPASVRATSYLYKSIMASQPNVLCLLRWNSLVLLIFDENRAFTIFLSYINTITNTWYRYKAIHMHGHAIINSCTYLMCRADHSKYFVRWIEWIYHIRSYLKYVRVFIINSICSRKTLGCFNHVHIGGCSITDQKASFQPMMLKQLYSFQMQAITKLLLTVVELVKYGPTILYELVRSCQRNCKTYDVCSAWGLFMRV